MKTGQNKIQKKMKKLKLFIELDFRFQFENSFKQNQTYTHVYL